MRLVALCVAIALSLSGCFLAPFIQSFKSAGATKGDRQALLPKEVKRFGEAMSWGNIQPVMDLVDESARGPVQQQLNASAGKERVVESRVVEMNFDESAYTASVGVKVKYYRIPYYVVQERDETLQWKFSMATGWKLTGRELSGSKPASALGHMG